MTDTAGTPRQASAAAAPPEREGFRQAMSWVHTWAGLVLGWLLFAIFVTGTLSFFKSEFNLWMRPEMHGLPAASADVAERAQAALHRHAPGVTQWIMRLPDDRMPAATVLWRDNGTGRFQTLLMNPVTGEKIEARETAGGEFFYRFHFELRTAHQGRWTIQGRWVVGVATVLMFIALLTGVVTHRRIFKDFFTFRPGKGGQRAWLDAHNVSGVLVLPFYLVITFSGLMIFHALYMPAGIAAAYPTPKGTDSQAYFAEMQGDAPGARSARRGRGTAAAEPLPILDLGAMVASAHRTWGDARIGNISVRRDDSGTVVEITRHDGDRLQYGPARMRFDGDTARQLALIDPHTPAIQTYGVLYGLHLARFAGPGMRWVLFGFGVMGSLMIASGLVLWSVKRRAQAQRKAPSAPMPFGERLVASLNVGLMGGLPLAVAAILAANRLLPVPAPARPDAELAWFFGAWGLGLVVGILRPDRRGWALLLGAAGALFLALPVVNALTTSTHLGATLPAGDWVWAGMDLSFIAAGAVFALLAWRLLRRRPAAAAKASRAALASTGTSGTTPVQGA
ncbi:PepSY-associated TM helix domain-containing protein [Acidovorax sp. NCPPB 4044]|uniref:PepSY-associated TM helix domain-containing protein n=1 Tax=Acidovorax sp. NCPPB 4044 TaxID=2940490 RepID=UPI0023025FC6|nr:PepSY-associated TM helix domain-containing protein [Acidovorax sp. NCPPB 4044]MDA8519890.1 PepSY domain-containing protein [Acidovorax sp. NCPPB 4044]